MSMQLCAAPLAYTPTFDIEPLIIHHRERISKWDIVKALGTTALPVIFVLQQQGAAKLTAPLIVDCACWIYPSASVACTA